MSFAAAAFAASATRTSASGDVSRGPTNTLHRRTRVAPGAQSTEGQQVGAQILAFHSCRSVALSGTTYIVPIFFN